MSEYIFGVQTKCKDQNNELAYVHCYAHCLNLVLVDACLLTVENRMLLDFFGILQLACNFTESRAVHHAVFERICQTVGTKLKTLKSLSTTW